MFAAFNKCCKVTTSKKTNFYVQIIKEFVGYFFFWKGPFSNFSLPVIIIPLPRRNILSLNQSQNEKAFNKLSYNLVETNCGSSQKGRVTLVIWQKFSFEMQMEQIKLRSGWKRICSPHPLKKLSVWKSFNLFTSSNSCLLQRNCTKVWTLENETKSIQIFV